MTRAARRACLPAVAAGLLVGSAPAAIAAQDAVAEQDAGALCPTLPVHTAALAEQIHLADLGAVLPRPGSGPAPAATGSWSPETRLSDRVRTCFEAGGVGPAEVLSAGYLRVGLLPAAIELRHTTGYPRTMTDGSFRPGVGTMTGMMAGFVAAMGPVTLVVRPELHHHRNADFDIAEQSISGHARFIHPLLGTRIDLPQRFGDESFGLVHPGQTTIRLDWRGFAAGASTENAWWGPGLRNPLLLSSAAPGLPHVFLGTARPVDIRIGKVFLRTMVGRATESDFFDLDPDNDHQLLSGTIASFEPAPVPGLTLGAARFFAMRDHPDVDLGAFLRAAFSDLQANPLGADPLADNQYLSIFARWAFPTAGLEVYGEFGRSDHWGEDFELITSPQTSGAWMAGFQKVIQRDRAAWRVMLEAASLLDPLPTLVHGRPTNIFWYTHSQLRQGHTHQGQLLGAPIGPDARSQILAIDRYTTAGDIGVELARTVYNHDSYNRTWWNQFGTYGLDTELSALLRGRRALGAFDLHAGLGYRRRWNRQFMGLAELVGTDWQPEDMRRDGSWYVEVRGTWVGR